MKQKKNMVANRFIRKNAPIIEALTQEICSGDKSTFDQYDALAGPVPQEG
jgi:hypothetical protein